jgi:hypothetical protein
MLSSCDDARNGIGYEEEIGAKIPSPFGVKAIRVAVSGQFWRIAPGSS